MTDKNTLEPECEQSYKIQLEELKNAGSRLDDMLIMEDPNELSIAFSFVIDTMELAYMRFLAVDSLNERLKPKLISIRELRDKLERLEQAIHFPCYEMIALERAVLYVCAAMLMSAEDYGFNNKDIRDYEADFLAELGKNFLSGLCDIDYKNEILQRREEKIKPDEQVN